MLTLSSFAQTGQGGTSQRRTPIGGLCPVVDQEYDHDTFLEAVKSFCVTYNQGEVWELQPALSQNPEYFSRFLNIITQIREDKSGTDHYIYRFSEDATKPEDIELMAVIPVNYILDSDNIYRKAELTNFEYAENVDAGREARRIKATFRMRNDGHFAIRYLRQDAARKWHVESIGVYKMLGESFTAMPNYPGKLIMPRTGRGAESYLPFLNLSPGWPYFGSKQLRKRAVAYNQVISSEPEQIPVGDIWTLHV